MKKLSEYDSKLGELLKEFHFRFADLNNLKISLNFLVIPFEIDVVNDGLSIPHYILNESATGEMELLELQEDHSLKMHHKSTQSANEFWKLVSPSKYPNLRKAASRLLSIFGTTYCCESLFSTMKFIKSKHRSQLTNEHLTELIRTALTNYEPNFRKCSAKLQTHMPSTSKQ